ncbi:helix-turn-helix domain-containing protein [Streptomyces sp. NPDC056405]|uniref:helix-turn-helix domain-containing protein n=1 Tax=Streptomyces sp. NPDC056405 TaxID=3345811 RepID=UPI0035D68C55
MSEALTALGMTVSHRGNDWVSYEDLVYVSWITRASGLCGPTEVVRVRRFGTDGKDQFLTRSGGPAAYRSRASAARRTISQVGNELEMIESGSGPRRRYTYSEAAEILRVKERWLRENIKRLPHSKKGATVTFSEADLDSIDAMFHHQPAVPVVSTLPQGTHPLASIKPAGPQRRRQ